ncbi:hypothetical protein GW17_00033307 [Ensete ventricosum]|nr:hypothetical protein GW17_00033307 [Ensete ventricosum]
MILVLWTVVTAAFIGTAEGHRHNRWGGSETELEAFQYAAAGAGGCRAHVASLTDFGGVGDGVTSNTAAFAAAVANLSKVACDGGAMLVVPAGRWLTGPFNLTNHFTLFLDHDAVILATQVRPLPPTSPPSIYSSSNVRIEDCYIVSGDDCIAIKSGWDEYGIAFNMSSKHIVIRRLTCISPTSAVIALGSEMSGGIEDVRAEDITAINSESGVRIKTAIGRGAYVKDIFVRRMNLHTMKWVFWMTGTYGQHPDDNFDPKAIPVVQNISYNNVVAENVTMAAKLEGIPGAPFTGICIYNVSAEVVKSKKPIWNCTDVEGVSSHVTPTPCAQIPEYPDRITHCPFPEDDLPVDCVGLKECSYRRTKP